VTGPRRIARYGNPGGHEGEIEVVRRRLVWTWKLRERAGRDHGNVPADLRHVARRARALRPRLQRPRRGAHAYGRQDPARQGARARRRADAAVLRRPPRAAVPARAAAHRGGGAHAPHAAAPGPPVRPGPRLRRHGSAAAADDGEAGSGVPEAATWQSRRRVPSRESDTVSCLSRPGSGGPGAATATATPPGSACGSGGDGRPGSAAGGQSLVVVVRANARARAGSCAAARARATAVDIGRTLRATAIRPGSRAASRGASRRRASGRGRRRCRSPSARSSS
jgi:hypothetical protein